MECKDGVCYMKPRGGMTLAAVEVDTDSVVLEWTPRKGYDKFQVDLLEQGEWRTLSDVLSSPFLKKKNLQPGQSYQFRVRGSSGGKWTDFSQPLEVKTPETPCQPAPIVSSMIAQDDGKSIATVTWRDAGQGSIYHVQMRRMQADDLEWQTLSENLKGCAVRKKNLDPAPDYVFRVRHRSGNATEFSPWSLVSKPTATAVLSPSFSSMLGDTLLRRGAKGYEKISTSSLAGKIVLIYFSAHWCPPCRQQTAMMLQQYPALKAKGLPVEIVFISADRDQGGFNEYFGSMPWLALPFESPRRQQLMATYQVNGIPKLMVFSPSGKVITDNAAGAPLTEQMVNTWRQQV